MEKLFAAILNQHPQCEVVDVRFLANKLEVNDQNVDELDAALADAVMNAGEPVTQPPA